MKKKKFIILIIIICAGLIIWYFNTFTIKTNYEIIESEKIVDEITIIQISDLHGSSFGRNNKELIKKIEKEKPDIICVTGDMYTAKDEKGKQIALKLLQELAKSYKVYFVNGEHDCDEKFIQNLKDNEVNVLDYKKETIAIKNTKINLYKDSNNVYKTGLYVNDKIIGIGTLTFIDPNTKMYGALVHEIMEKTTGTKFEIKDGTIFKSNVTGIDKGTRNSPGGKRASYMLDDTYGTITKNEINGIYGVYNKNIDTANLIEVADSSSIKLGKAYFTTVIKDDTKETFEINILKINKNDALTVARLISSHMGPWNIDKKSYIVLPKPKEEDEKFVLLCDYLASRRFLDVSFKDNEIERI